VYLFHELPAAVRRKAAAEMARVCKPGGMVVSMGLNLRKSSFAASGLDLGSVFIA
jgi:ubiquinone/menaquinone biosynthesis C-methylase UbiE